MKNYPINITRQQFELIRPALEIFVSELSLENMTSTRSSVRSYMSWKPVANGVKFPVISQNGGQFTTITKFSQLKLNLRLILYWNKF